MTSVYDPVCQATAFRGALAPAPRRAPSHRARVLRLEAAGRAWDDAHPAVRTALARSGVRVDPGTWLKAQLDKRRAHLRRAAEALGLDPDMCEAEGFACIMPSPADRKDDPLAMHSPYTAKPPARPPTPGLGDPRLIAQSHPGPVDGRPRPGTGIRPFDPGVDPGVTPHRQPVTYRP